MKSYSSGWTKAIFTGLPIIGAFTLPIAHGINSYGSGNLSIDGLKTGMEYINPLKYDSQKEFCDKANLAHVALGALNLSMISQSLHSLKNFFSKYQQDTNRIIDVKINGHEQEIVAKGTLPISTYLGDLFMIGGTAGYFATSDTWGKVGFAAGGILGSIICKAICDDSSDEIDSRDSSGINNSVVNSNNTYIYNSNNNNHQSTTKSDINDAAVAGMVLILALVAIYKAGDTLINDSTPGLYQYNFCDGNGRDLHMSIEWDKDDHHIFDQYGREIEVV